MSLLSPIYVKIQPLFLIQKVQSCADNLTYREFRQQEVVSARTNKRHHHHQVAILGLFWRHRIKVILNKMLLPASKFSVSQVICRRLYLYKLYTSPRHHPLSHYPLPPRPIVCIGQTSHGPHKPRRRWYVHSSRYIWSSAPIFCFCKNK